MCLWRRRRGQPGTAGVPGVAESPATAQLDARVLPDQAHPAHSQIPAAAPAALQPDRPPVRPASPSCR